MKLKAVIFDLDGTVMDNDNAYVKAFNNVLASLGIDTTNPVAHIKGVGLVSNWRYLTKELQLDPGLDIDKLCVQTQVEYQKYLGEVRLREGFTILAEELKRNKVKLALATSNNRDMTQRVMDMFFITKYFDAVVTVDEVHYPKPHPEIFLLAAAKLNADPVNTVVIEDSCSGVEAAKKAGMGAVLVNSNCADYGADLSVHYFYELNYQNIKDLV